jgi:rhodanese-related sulfurtransferase
VDELLAESRAQLRRVTPEEAARQLEAGTAVVDIRSESQRARDGVIPGSHFVPRNVLEWRLDPACAHAIPELGRDKRIVILVCNEGFQSSLAAATLRRLGVDATDVVGGFEAWRDADLPVDRRTA